MSARRIVSGIFRWYGIPVCALLAFIHGSNGNSAAAFAWIVAGCWWTLNILNVGLIRQYEQITARHASLDGISR